MFVFDEIYENIILSLDVLIIFFTVEKKLRGKQLSYHTKNTKASDNVKLPYKSLQDA